jgi:hypothetical protein
LSTNNSDAEIQRFFKAYIKVKNGQITEQTNDVFKVTYPNGTNPQEYTYQPTISREKKIPLITTGSPAIQQVLNECLKNGVLCQILLAPKQNFETLLKTFFKDNPLMCESCPRCRRVKKGDEEIKICSKPQPCYHQVKNGKIVSLRSTKTEPVKYFQFYFSATFQNKLRPKNEEIISIMIDEEGTIVSLDDSVLDNILKNGGIDVQDFKGKLKAELFEKLKKIVDEKLDSVLKEKLILFDLPLYKEKKSKLRSYEKRLKRERREQVISRKHDFDYQKWQANYEALLKREEESFITYIAVKFINLLVINTTKVSFELNLDNNAIIHSWLRIGIDRVIEVTCPICRKTFYEGYATQDSLYVCGGCIKQSIDTKKIYSKKVLLRLDETLNEYIEPDSGFVCSVCGKRHSKLLEFKCSHDNSSVCIHHYGLCDICGNVFSKLNLSSTQEFKRKLCPKHNVECENCHSIIGIDEGRLCKASGKRYCDNCMSFTKCALCQQEYSTESLTDNKCPACNNLKDSNDPAITFITRNFDNSPLKTAKWLVGKNVLNMVAIKKSLFSTSLYVIENDKVTYQKSISLLDKLKEN